MAKNTITLALAPTPTPEELLEQLAVEQASIAERIAAVRAQLARGTGDVTAAAAAARATAALTPPTVRQPLPTRIAQALRDGCHSLEELTRIVRAPAGPVGAALKRMRAARQIYNIGSEDQPVYTWIVGDDVGTDVLYPLIERLIRIRPFGHAELMTATGGRRGRVSGAIVDIQKRYGRDGVINAGTEARARWFLPPRSATAQPRRAA